MSLLRFNITCSDFSIVLVKNSIRNFLILICDIFKIFPVKHRKWSANMEDYCSHATIKVNTAFAPVFILPPMLFFPFLSATFYSLGKNMTKFWSTLQTTLQYFIAPTCALYCILIFNTRYQEHNHQHYFLRINNLLSTTLFLSNHKIRIITRRKNATLKTKVFCKIHFKIYLYLKFWNWISLITLLFNQLIEKLLLLMILEHLYHVKKCWWNCY